MLLILLSPLFASYLTFSYQRIFPRLLIFKDEVFLWRDVVKFNRVNHLVDQADDMVVQRTIVEVLFNLKTAKIIRDA